MGRQVEQLRQLKVHFLLRRGGPGSGKARVVVISRGATLQGWVADLRAHPRGRPGRAKNPEVVAVDWRPGRKGPCPLPAAARLHRNRRLSTTAATAGATAAAALAASAAAAAGEGGQPGSRGDHKDGGGGGQGGAQQDTSSGGGAVLRLWGFGKAAVQQKVREQVPDWNEETDLFVA